MEMDANAHCRLLSGGWMQVPMAGCWRKGFSRTEMPQVFC